MAGPFSGAGRLIDPPTGKQGRSTRGPAASSGGRRPLDRPAPGAGGARPKGGDGAPNSRIAGPIRRRSTSHCLAPGSQTPLPYASAHRIGAGTAPRPSPRRASRIRLDRCLAAHPQVPDCDEGPTPTRADLVRFGSSLTQPCRPDSGGSRIALDHGTPPCRFKYIRPMISSTSKISSRFIHPATPP